MKQYFITAIGTDSGKTLASAIIVEALKADYWKPVQCGEPRDTDAIKCLISNSETQFHSEAYFLKKPASPHDAAKEEGIEIDIKQIKRYYTSLNPQNPTLIVEGAGGLLVPLNDTDFVIDIPQLLNVSVILVANLYLGSINHTLLTINELERRQVEVAGIIFNGEPNPESERIILHHSGYKKLLHILPEKEITKKVIKKYATELNFSLFT